MENDRKDKTYEENIMELETIIKELESGNCPLEETISKFTRGMELLKVCGDKLTSATDKINKILNENGELEDFDTPTE